MKERIVLIRGDSDRGDLVKSDTLSRGGRTIDDQAHSCVTHLRIILRTDG